MLDTTNLVLFYDYVPFFRSIIYQKKEKKKVEKVEETRKNTNKREDAEGGKNLFYIYFSQRLTQLTLVYRHTCSRT